MSTKATPIDVLEGRALYSVVQGDCLELLRQLPDKCGVVLTDVPYNVGKDFEGDKLPWEEYLPWLDARMIECCRVGRLAFSFFATTKLIRFIRESSNPPDYEINWHKPMMLHDTSLNGCPFLMHREPILYWGPMKPSEAGKLGYDSFAINAMWPSERRREGIEHPTPKPPKLIAAVIPRWLRPGEPPIDPFCGSGTHLLEAIRAGHPAIGFDVDERWVNDTVARIEAELHHTSIGADRRLQFGLFDNEDRVRATLSEPPKPKKQKRQKKTKKEEQPA